MKILYRNKILINGLFPMKNYSIDGYKEKTATYDESNLDMKKNNNIFYLGGYLLFSLYSPINEKEKYYEYFENDNLFELEIPDDIYNDDYKRQKIILSRLIERVRLLEKKLRLISNMKIGLPIFEENIYDKNKKFLMNIGYICNKSSLLKIHNYDEEQKKIVLRRLSTIHMSDNAILKLEEKNNRFKRALMFFNESFLYDNKSISFTLLFSSLESLFNFNVEGEKITDIVSEYTSKIFFLTPKKTKEFKYKIIDYYDKRSRFIHGDEPIIINDKIEFNFREIVRKVLLIYWNISIVYDIYNSKELRKLLDNINRTNLDFQVQLFIKYLDKDGKEYRKLYENIRKDLLASNTNILESNY